MLRVRWVNQVIWVWLLQNPLIWQYAEDGSLLGVMDYSRIDYILKGGISKNRRFFEALKLVEQGAKQQRDILVKQAMNESKRR